MFGDTDGKRRDAALHQTGDWRVIHRFAVAERNPGAVIFPHHHLSQERDGKVRPWICVRFFYLSSVEEE